MTERCYHCGRMLIGRVSHTCNGNYRKKVRLVSDGPPPKSYTNEELLALAEKNPAPQEWFDEDYEPLDPDGALRITLEDERKHTAGMVQLLVQLATGEMQGSFIIDAAYLPAAQAIAALRRELDQYKADEYSRSVGAANDQNA